MTERDRMLAELTLVAKDYYALQAERDRFVAALEHIATTQDEPGDNADMPEFMRHIARAALTGTDGAGLRHDRLGPSSGKLVRSTPVKDT